MDLEKLAVPFPAEDVEWRVSRSGMGPSGLYCFALAYITARAIQRRLDEVCGPANWRNESPQIITVDGKSAFVGGISIRCGDEWLTKWDVADPTHIEPAKGGFSGAMKRAGAQWGIGRYLYHLSETYVETSESKMSGWNYAAISKGGAKFWWKNPTLPGWALPKDSEHEVSAAQLNQLKVDWRAKFAPDVTSPAELRDGFARFVRTTIGEFPHGDHECWTSDALEKCHKQLAEATAESGISGVPFEV